MRDRFVQGSMRTQPDLDLETANKVFDMVRGFTGYGSLEHTASRLPRLLFKPLG